MPSSAAMGLVTRRTKKSTGSRFPRRVASFLKMMLRLEQVQRLIALLLVKVGLGVDQSSIIWFRLVTPARSAKIRYSARRLVLREVLTLAVVSFSQVRQVWQVI